MEERRGEDSARRVGEKSGGGDGAQVQNASRDAQSANTNLNENSQA